MFGKAFQPAKQGLLNPLEKVKDISYYLTSAFEEDRHLLDKKYSNQELVVKPMVIETETSNAIYTSWVPTDVEYTVLASSHYLLVTDARDPGNIKTNRYLQISALEAINKKYVVEEVESPVFHYLIRKPEEAKSSDLESNILEILKDVPVI